MRNLLESTTQEALDEMVKSTHDLAFNYGPFGEGFCSTPGMWLGSVAKLEPSLGVDPEVVPQPLPNEPYVTLSWDLEMTPDAQVCLFKRIRNVFDRVTGMVPTQQKKKYRMNPEELKRARDLVVLYSQIEGHLQSRLSKEDFQSWRGDVEKDLLNLLQLRPACFSMSMLLSYQQQAKKDNQDIEMKEVELVEQQKQEVTAAQWAYFTAALKSDQAILDKVSAAPLQVRQRLHVKQVHHRQKVVGAAEKACQGYQDRFQSFEFCKMISKRC